MRKRNRVVGIAPYINEATGEVIEFEIRESDEPERDRNFHKLFWNHFKPVLNSIANTKTKLFLWIIENAKRDNMLLYSYRQISAKTGISYRTVADTMKSLLDTDFIRKHDSGYYMINPDIIFKGTYQRRIVALRQYKQLEQENALPYEEKKLKEIRKNITRLQRQEQRIEKKIQLSKFCEDMDELA